VACALVQRQRRPQAHGRSCHIVEGLEEDHPLPQALAVFPEAGRLPHQRCQGLPHGQVHPFDQGRADREAQVRQACGAKHDARAERQQLALLLLRDQLPVDQIGMGRTAGQAGAPPLAGPRKRRHDVEGSDEGRQRAREAVAEERRDARDTRLRGCHNFCGGVERARPHHGRDHQATLGGNADPDPLPPILTVGQAFPCRVRLTRVLARDEVPHLVELHLGDRQVAQQVSVERFRLLGCTPKPCQHRLFRHPKHQADACQINPDQEHLESHHDFFF